MKALPNNKPRCPKCFSKSSVALPSQAIKTTDGKIIMAFRCRNCGDVFNEWNGIQETPSDDKPINLSKGSFAGLDKDERLEKIREILGQVVKKP